MGSVIVILSIDMKGEVDDAGSLLKAVFGKAGYTVMKNMYVREPKIPAVFKKHNLEFSECEDDMEYDISGFCQNKEFCKDLHAVVARSEVCVGVAKQARQ